MSVEGRLAAEELRPAASMTSVRRFSGTQAEVLAVLCRPEGRQHGASQQAEAAYRALAESLAAGNASFADLTRETLFLRNIRRDLPLVLEGRSRVVAALGQAACAPLPAFIQQAPVTPGAHFELLAHATVPRDRGSWSVRDVRAVPSCSCPACARTGARLVRLGEQVSLETTNVYGQGSSALDQAYDMFCAAERLLHQCGMNFGDVVRAWIQLRDIDRDYDALNRARREFFRQRGIELRPASTGVAGGPSGDSHDFSLSLHAVRSPRAPAAGLMSTPTLNEAWSYGADFSRGLKVVEANQVTLHISGTASLDESGRTVHVGDFAAQAERMLTNIESLLLQQGAAFEHIVSGVTYLKHAADAPVLRSMYQRRGFDRFPCPLVEVDLCRPELLCETEVVALLPRTITGA